MNAAKVINRKKKFKNMKVLKKKDITHTHTHTHKSHLFLDLPAYQNSKKLLLDFKKWNSLISEKDNLP